MSVMWDDAHYVTNALTLEPESLSVVVPMMATRHSTAQYTLYSSHTLDTGAGGRQGGDPRRMRQSQEPFPAPRLPLLGAAHLCSSLISISDQSGSQHLPVNSDIAICNATNVTT